MSNSLATILYRPCQFEQLIIDIYIGTYFYVVDINIGTDDKGDKILRDTTGK